MKQNIKQNLILVLFSIITFVVKSQTYNCVPSSTVQSVFPQRVSNSNGCLMPNSYNYFDDTESILYIPTAASPTLQFRINFVIVDHPTIATIFTGIPHTTIAADAQNMINNMNSWYSTCGSIPQVINTGTPSPLVSNPKIQLVLNHVYFDTSSTFGYGSYFGSLSHYYAFPHDTANTLNFYFYTESTGAAGSGWASIPWGKFVAIALPSQAAGGSYQPGTIFNNPRLMWHELSHALGFLGDNYFGSSFNNADPIFGSYRPKDAAIDISASYNCSIPTSASTPTNANNNVMGSSFCREALSAKQIGAFHYLVAKNVTKKYTQFSNSVYPYTPVPTGQSIFTYTGTGTYTSVPNSFDSIIIKSGANITFSQSLLPARTNAKIVVEKGAKLTFTCVNAFCAFSQSMWNGVDVYGDATLSQTAANQGTFVIGNSVIQNANVGISVGKRLTDGTFAPNTGGGIVLSQMNNYDYNIVDVEFAPYIWRSRSYVGPATMGFSPINNKSTFTFDHFEKDSVGTGKYKYACVILNSVAGVKFQAATFQCFTKKVTYGILSLGSSFMVKGYSNQKTSVNGFVNGIYANSMINNSPIVIDSTVLASSQNNSIFLNNVINPRITNCLFNIGASGTTPAGLYLNGCTGYIVENNTFFGAATSADGLYVRQSGPYANSIYNNTFTNLDNGIWALGQNYDPAIFPYTGLTINCNDFYSCGYDINVYKSGKSLISTANNSGIAPSQGLANSGDQANVRNTYAVNTCTTENKYNINTGNSFAITSHGSFFGNQWHPTPQTSASCSNSLELVDIVGVSGAPPTRTVYCPTNVLPALSKSSLQTQISQLTQTVTSLKSLITSTVDGGNTSTLLNAISNRTMTASALKSLLTSYSPYLSDTVLKGYFAKSGVLATDIKDIHALNAPVSNAVWQVILNLHLSAGTQDYINTAQFVNNLSTCNQLRAKAQYYNNQLGQTYNEKINRFAADTTIGTVDSVLAVYNNTLLANGGVFKANLYTTIGNYTAATSQLTALSALGGLYTDYTFAQGEVIQLLQTPAYQATLAANTTKKERFQSILNTANYLAEGIAAALLKQVWNIDQLDEEKLSHSGGSSRLSSNQNGILGSDSEIELASNVKLYPNPTDGLLNIEYDSTSDNNETLVIKIIDVTGKTLLTQPCNKNCRIDANHLDNGIYFVNLVKQNKIISSKKIVIAK